ncbi:hypothetical protein [Streptomyces chrestomyceticus]|uniref:Uncharacterized protein n=1 Tax=Streptomyces chrestomyceticus TaxID=68185 RepID=A0ABU7WLJ7_9ACTN
MLTQREAQGAVQIMTRQDDETYVAEERDGSWFVLHDGQDVSMEAGKRLIDARAAGIAL